MGSCTQVVKLEQWHLGMSVRLITVAVAFWTQKALNLSEAWFIHTFIQLIERVMGSWNRGCFSSPLSDWLTGVGARDATVSKNVIFTCFPGPLEADVQSVPIWNMPPNWIWDFRLDLFMGNLQCYLSSSPSAWQNLGKQLWIGLSTKSQPVKTKNIWKSCWAQETTKKSLIISETASNPMKIFK